MKFLYEDYYRTSFLIPLIIIIVVMLIVIENALVLADIIHIKTKFKIANVLLSIIIATFFLLISSFSLSRSYKLPMEKDIDSMTIQSVVQDVTNMPFAEKYFVNNKTSYSKYIKIDGVKYYCMNADNIKPGMTVDIKYLPSSKFILEMEIIE